MPLFKGTHNRNMIIFYFHFLSLRYGIRMRAREEEKNPKKVMMKGGLCWIRGLRGQEQDMSSLALEWEPFFYL